jgi:DNA polymerase III delta prime subunit
MNILLKALNNMKEHILVNDVIVPLIEKIHPGRVEYTHSTIEAGRDIVSFGKDSLNRQHILCIQAKANKVTYGAQFQGIVANPSITAKTEGVTIENGNQCIPHEVWFITPSPFPEQERRQVAHTLRDLEKNNIKFIAGEELCDIITQNLPKLTKELCKYTNEEVVNLITILKRHSEGAAFEMDFDRNFNDFYVTASFSPKVDKRFLANGYSKCVQDFNKEYTCKISDYLLGNEELFTGNIEKLILEREKIRIKEKKLHRLFNIKFDIDILSVFEKKENVISRNAIEIYDICKKYRRINELKDIFIVFRLEVKIKSHFLNLIERVRKHLHKCPKTLTTRPNSIVTAYKLVKKLELFIELSSKEYGSILSEEYSAMQEDIFDFRIHIKRPENILKIGTNVLVEGQPGCGKTTLLKKIAISLLEKNRKIKFLNCCSINNKYIDKSLVEIVKDLSIGSINHNYENKDCILILDGLDESPIDLSESIRKECEMFSFIVASTRLAYNTSLRNDFFSIVLEPFSKEERDSFFNKIFSNDPFLISTCQQLFINYKDIDFHSKIPLIATIIATLIKNNLTPNTRSEIYNFRLKLLLSKWDRIRGVTRTHIDNPHAKLRFLKELAFKMHSLETRNRYIERNELRNVYEESLGSWGYQYNFDIFLHDLIVGSGIIVEVKENLFSLGHLSFQEHLAGEYLAENASVNDIINYLGKDWWKEPLLFWASNKGSITELLDNLMDTEQFHYYTRQLLELTIYAPYTSAGIVEILKDHYSLVSG